MTNFNQKKEGEIKRKKGATIGERERGKILREKYSKKYINKINIGKKSEERRACDNRTEKKKQNSHDTDSLDNSDRESKRGREEGEEDSSCVFPSLTSLALSSLSLCVCDTLQQQPRQ